MATHSSILAWEMPQTQRSLAGHNPWGHRRVSHYLVTEHFPLLSSPSLHMHTREHTGPGEALTSSMESNLCFLSSLILGLEKGMATQIKNLQTSRSGQVILHLRVSVKTNTHIYSQTYHSLYSVNLKLKIHLPWKLCHIIIF